MVAREVSSNMLTAGRACNSVDDDVLVWFQGVNGRHLSLQLPVYC